jgi:tetratricopeptide (TPR) repeat protein
MPRAKPDQQHLQSACRYIELGRFEEAQVELEKIDPFCRHLPELLSARIPHYRTLKRWDLMAIVAKKLTEWIPERPGNFIDWAYAARRAESIHAAHAILTRAASLHPADPTIQFNLACYEAQMGNLNRAKTHLERATETDAKFRLMALKDPDLELL